MAEPSDNLYRVESEPTEPGAVLVHGLTGFLDAGQAGRLAVEHLLERFEHRVVATFDADQLVDYRSRRPVMGFDTDHWTSYARPELVLHEVLDADGTPFLLLAGPEPDLQWERFSAAVVQLVEEFDVKLTVGLNAIPMGVPHTRPVTHTAHATRPELVAEHHKYFGTVQVPASMGSLLELRLGEAGHDAMGFAVHVPHYLARTEYPESAQGLVEQVSLATGLALPTDELQAAGRRVLVEVEEQISRSDEVTGVVRTLERQFDEMAEAAGRRSLLAADTPLPSGDELAAEVERFLAEQSGGYGEDRAD